MIAKALGLLDLTCMGLIILHRIMPHQVIMFFGMLLFAKGFIFSAMGNRVSILDVGAGIYMGLLVYGWSYYLMTIFFVLILAQKSVLSLLARG